MSDAMSEKKTRRLPVKIRLLGRAEDVQDILDRLPQAPGVTVFGESAPYPTRRGEGVRVYLEALADD
ncbi:hypothetical protein ACQEU5_07180 [Marinactinospora thermotolerans]|uniref:hypothetical protein n=1 Tax=Marinactinospora thermotolerans TaxID=531310 RepID=UPI003D8ABF31